MFKHLISIFILTILPFKMLPAQEVIRGVRYLKPNNSFSEVSDLYIQNNIITRIIESKQKESIRYVLPSFCDAYVTLGADGVGGQNNLNGIKTALKSLLLHGFTHIQSVADGPWIHRIKSDVDSGKIIGPKITISNRPLIPKSSELQDISYLLYFVTDNGEPLLKEFKRQITDTDRPVHIFNRYNENKDGGFSIDTRLLDQMRVEANDKNKFLTIHTFADRIAISDALTSGNRYLVHPILFEIQNQITKQHIEELYLVPILNVYRNLHFNDFEDEAGLLEFEQLRKKSRFFNENYSALYESNLKKEISEEELEDLKSEYSSYLKFIKNNPILKEKLILGSGAGNRLSFPGISGIQELKILAEALKPNEAFFRIPTQNSCSYLDVAYDGVLAVGREANLLILKENPVKNLDTLFQIEQIFIDGKPVRFDVPTKKRLPKKK